MKSEKGKQTRTEETTRKKRGACCLAKIFKLLLDAGADVNISAKGVPLIHDCVMLKNEKMAQKLLKLLLDYGADINTQNVFGWTPWLCAYEIGHQKTMDFLAEHGYL